MVQLSIFVPCGKEDISFKTFEVNFRGKVLVIGAGAAGITAAYLLKRHNIDFQVLEAAPVFGGRLKRADNFVDFPIDLGAEWIHTNPRVLAELISDPGVKGSIETVPYSPSTVQVWKNKRLRKKNWASNYYSEYKFKNTTWFGFFEKYFLPSIQNELLVDRPVTAIDYSGARVKVTDARGAVHEADRVLITAPVKILRGGSIEFTPELPVEKRDALSSITVPDSIKVFIEFGERFYPDILNINHLSNPSDNEEKVFYNASFGKNSSRHVLGLFTIGKPASEYVGKTNQEIIDMILAELDEIYDGKASALYQQHVIQNWSKEPYIQGAYSTLYSNTPESTANALLNPVSNKLFFAGEAMSTESWATVHGASKTAYTVVENLLKTR